MANQITKAEVLEAMQTERTNLESLEDITNPHRFPWTEGEPLVTSITANSY